MTSPIGQFVDSTTGRTSTNPFITIIKNRAPNGTDGINNMLQVGQRWIDASDANEEYFLLKFVSNGGVVQAEWVTLSSAGVSTETLTGNDSFPVNPVDNNINVLGDVATGLTFTGSGNTLTGTLAAIPNSSLANSSISLVAGTGITISTTPVSLGGTTTISATSSVVLEKLTGNSGGAVGPSAGNINVVGDGTTVEVVGNPGTNTLTISAISSAGLGVNIQTFSTNSTYTPTAGMTQCIIEVVGGGGGGGAANTTPNNVSAYAGGGGGGGYSRGIFSSTTIGASQAVIVGAGGAGGAGSGANNGATGGTTSVGSLISATGGVGGGYATRSTGTTQGVGGAGGTGSSGIINTTGGSGTTGDIGSLFSGYGGSTFFGGDAVAVWLPSGGSGAGNNATSYGGGGSGGAVSGNPAGVSGGNGATGFVIITEYIG